jgi:hypothetical protein
MYSHSRVGSLSPASIVTRDGRRAVSHHARTAVKTPYPGGAETSVAIPQRLPSARMRRRSTVPAGSAAQPAWPWRAGIHTARRAPAVSAPSRFETPFTTRAILARTLAVDYPGVSDAGCKAMASQPAASVTSRSARESRRRSGGMHVDVGVLALEGLDHGCADLHRADRRCRARAAERHDHRAALTLRARVDVRSNSRSAEMRERELPRQRPARELHAERASCPDRLSAGFGTS